MRGLSREYSTPQVQYTRWHCKQKIGHTKSMNVFADDMATRPFYILENAARSYCIRNTRELPDAPYFFFLLLFLLTPPRLLRRVAQPMHIRLPDVYPNS